MNTKYIHKVNSLFDGRKDRRYKIVENIIEDYPNIAHFQDKDIGCFFLSDLWQEENYVELKKLKIYDTNKGYGTKLLQILCDEADKYQVNIRVWPLPEENNKAISLDKLKAWYRRFGFEQESECYMIRKQRGIKNGKL